MKHGTEEDDTCNRGGCEGTMAIDQDPCVCSFISNPPCCACENCRLVCDTCEWDADEEFEEPTPLDKLKSYRYESKE